MNRPLQKTKGQGNGGRKTRRGSCVTLCREVSLLSDTVHRLQYKTSLVSTSYQVLKCVCSCKC